MRAFVHLRTNGRDALGTGHSWVTPEYIGVGSMKRNFLDKLPAGLYHVEVFHNWDNRYGTPDRDFVYEVKI
jgi:hypothetical protein